MKQITSRSILLLMTQSPSIETLLQTLPPTDPRLAEGLLENYGTYVFRLCLSILADREEAKDAAQETFLAALQHLGQYQPGTNLRAWLSTIAVNLCRMQLRRQKSRRLLHSALQIVATLTGHTAEPEEAAVHNDAQARLWAAINALDEKHRLPVVLHYVQEIPTQEVADILGISKGTVHSRLHHASRQLQRTLARMGYDFLEPVQEKVLS